MAREPQWWLERLATRMDLRLARLQKLRQYLDGDAPLPEGAEGCRNAYKLFQKKARTNFAELIVDAMAERMRVSGFLVGDGNEDDDQARAFWQYNNLDAGSNDVHRDMLGLSEASVMISPPETGEDIPIITPERPEQLITESDPLRPYVVRAALKVYRDEPEGFDFAFLHLPGAVIKYRREINDITAAKPQPITTIVGKWEEDGAALKTGLTVVPIVPFCNRRGLGEFENHTDVLDRINWTILQRLVITAMQAYRQRATKGDLPDVDEEGNEIDYSEVFRPGPGALWRLPEGVELWESGQTDIGQILNATKDDIRDLAAVTRTPVSVLMPEGQNQSAEGASFAREGLVFKTEDRLSRARWSHVMAIALEMAGTPSPRVQTRWFPVERQSLAERYDALSKAGPDVPWRTKMTSILQFPEDEVDRMETERAQDALLAATLAPEAPAKPEPTSAPAG